VSAVLRSARIVSETSAAFSIVTSTIAVATGLYAGSVVLVAFGAIGYVDATGSIALAHHFRHGLRNETLDDRFERRAHRIVKFGLLSVGAATIVVSVVRLVTGATTEETVLGAAVAAVSVVVLAILSARKVRVAAQVPSPALRSDGHLSAVGAMQAAVALVGIVFSVDALAAAAVGVVAVVLGARAKA
jgi:divalent metal cation (Fe/Co/Zn/Cd) transporter